MKKAPNKRRENELEDLVQELDRFLFFKKISRILRPYRFVLVMLTVLLLVTVGYLAWERYQKRPLTPEETEAYAQSLIAQSAQEYDYLWTAENLETIKADELGHEGTKLTDILKTYGKPSDMQINEGDPTSFFIIYQKYAFDKTAHSVVAKEEGETMQDVALGIKRIDGAYRVFAYFGRFIAEDYPLKKGENPDLKGRANEIAALEVADFLEEKAGVLPEEVIAEFGPPTYSYISMDSILPKSLGLNYHMPDSDTIYHLSFEEGMSGEYRLHNIFIWTEDQLKD
ncbi:hypothetical protein ABID29_000532 [Streptococcus rupicaprae]|uniref:Uncharacterized protein n=1 Tax=Streptococcus rupicaprae TaxID=759619 RepID=A0ABV2FFS8_9STRE